MIHRTRITVLAALALYAGAALADPIVGAPLTHYLQPFRTFNGQPLVTLLARYDVTPIAAEITSTDAGRTIVDLTLRTESFKLPCAALHDWFVDSAGNAGRGDATVEFAVSGARMPDQAPNASGDPVLYWLQTGRCVSASSAPAASAASAASAR